jgi:nitrite reductase/ring-hydroxylating ferredoxin subunit
MDPKPYPGYPNGWFAVAFSTELKPGQLLNRRIMGQEIVVFRTASGKPAVLDAHCPHLGAHFGHGHGRVEGEGLRCPFHDFTFGVDGVCTATLYGSKPPPKAVVRAWPLHEVNGFIFVYYDSQGRPPAWQIPAAGWQGWLPFQQRSWEIRGHSQDICENGFDIGHLAVIHLYDNCQLKGEAEFSGPFSSISYAMRRKLVANWRVLSEFSLREHGLGFSLVDVMIPAFKLPVRLGITSTLTDPERITIRAAITTKAVPPRNFHPLLALLPSGLFNRLVCRYSADGFANDIEQDFPIWNNKVYIDPPILAKGDGPIGRFRQWARQFYL